MGRKLFNKEYKMAAINLVKEEKLKISEAARQLTLF
jgi:transposase-like protein